MDFKNLFETSTNDFTQLKVLEKLAEHGVKFIALRCAGFNNVDLKKAKELGIKVVRVPAYSPESVAEFAVGMIMTVVRKYHKAYNRVREGNFLLDGKLLLLQYPTKQSIANRPHPDL